VALKSGEKEKMNRKQLLAAILVILVSTGLFCGALAYSPKAKEMWDSKYYPKEMETGGNTHARYVTLWSNTPVTLTLPAGINVDMGSCQPFFVTIDAHVVESTLPVSPNPTSSCGRKQEFVLSFSTEETTVLRPYKGDPHVVLIAETGSSIESITVELPDEAIVSTNGTIWLIYALVACALGGVDYILIDAVILKK
jgi:hypothetical protein